MPGLSHFGMWLGFSSRSRGNHTAGCRPGRPSLLWLVLHLETLLPTTSLPRAAARQLGPLLSAPGAHLRNPPPVLPAPQGGVTTVDEGVPSWPGLGVSRPPGSAGWSGSCTHSCGCVGREVSAQTLSSTLLVATGIVQKQPAPEVWPGGGCQGGSQGSRHARGPRVPGYTEAASPPRGSWVGTSEPPQANFP